ncbi:MAG: flagellar export chaperone FlgN [Pseudomonadota bacterium]
MTNKASASSLEKTLHGLETALTELLACLRAEAFALADPTAADIDVSSARKKLAIQRVDDLEKIRQSLCLAQNLSDDPSEMPANLKALFTPANNMQACWERCLDHLELCQQQNLTNGAMLQLRHRFASKALGVLRGTESEKTYSAAGLIDTDPNNARFYRA